MIAHPDRNLLVLDIDGTIADDGSRWLTYNPAQHPTGSAERDAAFDAYYAAAPHDPPNEWVLALARAMIAGGFAVRFATGRPERLRTVTLEWLRRHFAVDDDHLLMRPDDDRRRNPEMKAHHARTIGPDRIALWVDDHPEVAAALAPFGVPVLTLHHAAAAWATTPTVLTH